MMLATEHPSMAVLAQVLNILGHGSLKAAVLNDQPKKQNEGVCSPVTKIQNHASSSSYILIIDTGEWYVLR